MRRHRFYSKSRQTRHKRPRDNNDRWRIGHRWKKVIYCLLIAFVIAFVANYTDSSWLKGLNIVAWMIATYQLYKRPFYYVNNLNMYNDLTFWIVKIVGIILIIAGSFLGMFFFIGTALYNYDPLISGTTILLFGLCILGLFMLFRTKRRFNIIGIHGAN